MEWTSRPQDEAEAMLAVRMVASRTAALNVLRQRRLKHFQFNLDPWWRRSIRGGHASNYALDTSEGSQEPVSKAANSASPRKNACRSASLGQRSFSMNRST